MRLSTKHVRVNYITAEYIFTMYKGGDFRRFINIRILRRYTSLYYYYF